MELELEPLKDDDDDKEQLDDNAKLNRVDRRKGDRRHGHDRRGEVRFEGGKDNRRSGKDRRKKRNNVWTNDRRD